MFHFSGELFSTKSIHLCPTNSNLIIVYYFFLALRKAGVITCSQGTEVEKKINFFFFPTATFLPRAGQPKAYYHFFYLTRVRGIGRIFYKDWDNCFLSWGENRYLPVFVKSLLIKRLYWKSYSQREEFCPFAGGWQ